MRKGIAVLVAAVAISLSLAAGGVAQARTRTPTATPTMFYLLPTYTPTPIPTPEQIAQFQGAGPWVDGRLSNAPVTAKIGDVDCGLPHPVAIVCDPGPCGPMWGLNVVSNQIRPGCGYEGATIQFYAGTQPAQTAIWHGGSWQPILLIAGPPFAMTFGTFVWNGNLPDISYAASPTDDAILVPHIGEVACGYTLVLRPQIGSDASTNSYEYWIVTFSDQQQAGCGYEGAPITLKLFDSRHNLVATALEEGTWHAWNGGSSNESKVNLTLVTPNGIRIGSVGTGDSQGRGDAPAGIVVLGLALAGLVAVAAGATLRKRRT